MKNLLTYLTFIVLFGFTFSACTKEDVGGVDEMDPYANMPKVELTISIPGSENNSRVSGSTNPDKQEKGNDYENTILASLTGLPGDDLHLFAFKLVDNHYEFISELVDLSISSNETGIIRTIKGSILTQDKIAGEIVKLVLMANYSNRGVTTNLASQSEYADLKELTFDYLANGSAWSAKDGNEANAARRFIPMTGECEFKVQKKNNVHINLKRAIAKVRVSLKSTSNPDYTISAAQIINAKSGSYCIEHKQKNVLTTPAHPKEGSGLDEDLKKNNLSIKAGSKESVEFYLPEQTNTTEKPPVQLVVTLKDSKGNTTKHALNFKNYNDNKTYDIERNFIYEFVLNKKEEQTVDISLNLMDWVAHDIITDFE